MVSVRLRQLTLAGLFVGLVFVSKLYLAFTTDQFRFSFHDIPLLLSGVLLGPYLGSVVGFVADLIYGIQSGFPFSFLMNLSDVIWGLMAGLFLYSRRYNLTLLWVSSVVIVTSLVSFGINSVQLYIWFNTGMFAALPTRIIAMVIKWPITIGVVMLMVPRLQPFMENFE
jgi:ECF transporter S component (folate family)